jgi:hypothetical protein
MKLISGAQVLLLLGVSCAMIIVPGGTFGALLKSFCPKMCVGAESFGMSLDVLIIFNIMTGHGSNLSNK